MAHNPMKPDEHIATNMHGFDPLSKHDANILIDGFTNLDPSKGIDKTQKSFYLDADTLTNLLQAERNTNSGFDGFRVMFGLDAHNRIVLLINRVRITEDVKGIRHFEYVPQLDTIWNTERPEVILLEYASLTVNEGAHTQLHRVDINGDDYRQFRLDFQAKFALDNPPTSYRITAKSILKTFGHDPGKPFVFKQRHFVTGFYIGWGTLELIRNELSTPNKGIKLWLGYGTLTRNSHSARCLQLVTIAANEPGDTVGGYRKPTVWSTQDQTQATLKLDNRIATQPRTVASQPTLPVGDGDLTNQSTYPVEFPVNLGQSDGIGTMSKTTLGSSCSDSTTETL